MVFNAFSSANIPPKLKKCQAPIQFPVTDLGMELTPRGTVELERDKLRHQMDITEGLLRMYAWNVGILQQVIGSWNWLLLMGRPAMSILNKIF